MPRRSRPDLSRAGRVPNVCGLVGHATESHYMMPPVGPSDNIDAGNMGSVFPEGDQTNPDDNLWNELKCLVARRSFRGTK